MKFLILLIVVLILAWKFWPGQGASSAEDSFLGPQIESMEKSRDVEDAMMEAVERQEAEIEKQSGDG